MELSLVLVFLAGILSFVSPCVIPILPVYMSYLAGNTSVENDGKVRYSKKKVFLNTIFFVLGISVSFFILGIAFTSVGRLFTSNRDLINIISGIIIMFFGIFQLGIINIKRLNKVVRINKDFSKKKISYIGAFVMGFAFSFAWTPCVGPILSSVLLIASNSDSYILGNILVLVYTLGFVIPFIILGLFTTKMLELFKKNMKIITYVTKTGGVILILIGIIMITGLFNNLSGYLVNAPSLDNILINEEEISNNEVNLEDEKDEVKEEELIEIIDFTLIDQNGNEHTLSEYKGKYVILNFWATGCPPCKEEVPLIQDTYVNNDNSDIVIITVVNPNGFLEKDKEYINEFIKDNNITFPVLFDEDSIAFNEYGIMSLPTTFVINKESKILGYISGMMTEDTIEQLLNDLK